MGDDLPPTDLGKGRTVKAVQAGGQHACALLDDATVKCWGKNEDGVLGLGDARIRGDLPGQMGDRLPAVDLGKGRTARALAVGEHHVCAVLDTGAVKCWGQNRYGQLGLGDTDARGDGPGEMGDKLPEVDLGKGRTAVSITAGGTHTCAVLDDGAVKCWGTGSNGRLGTGSRDDHGAASGQMGDALPEVKLR